MYFYFVDKDPLLHFFDAPIIKDSWPKVFPFPFYHNPDPIALLASQKVKDFLNQSTLAHDFNEKGKMFGVLVVEYKKNKLGFLIGFSGKLQNDERPVHFVPPIVDVHKKDSFYKKEENA